MSTKLVLQGNPREALKKLVNKYEKEKQEGKDLLLETTVETVSKENPDKFFENYEKFREKQEVEVLANEEEKLDSENKELSSKIAKEIRDEEMNYGKRWKFYVWFGLFTLMVITGYILFVMYRIGEMEFIKNV